MDGDGSRREPGEVLEQSVRVTAWTRRRKAEAVPGVGTSSRVAGMGLVRARPGAEQTAGRGVSWSKLVCQVMATLLGYCIRRGRAQPSTWLHGGCATGRRTGRS